MGVYLSDLLEQRMAAFKDRINWSKIAQEAFERAIKYEELMETNVDEAKLERLRASRDAKEEARNAEGAAAGKRWALDEADHEQLERVASLDISGVVDSYHDSAKDDAAKTLAAALCDDEDVHWDDVAAQMEMIFGRKSPSLAEIEGFIEGATEIYSQV